VIAFKVDGARYRVDVDLVTGAQEGELRAGTGMGLQQLGADLSAGAVGVFHVGILIWLARRQAGDKVALGVVLDEITYGAEFEWLPVEDDHPEASAGS